MANFSITISNAVRAFGPEESSKWQAYNWNAFKWGEGTAALPFSFTHVVDTTYDILSSEYFQVRHLIEESVTLDTEIYRTFSITLTPQVLTLDGDLSSERLSDGSGYSYLYPDSTTDAEGRDFVTYTQGTAAGTTWASATTATTTWS